MKSRIIITVTVTITEKVNIPSLNTIDDKENTNITRVHISASLYFKNKYGELNENAIARFAITVLSLSEGVFIYIRQIFILNFVKRRY